MKHHGMIFNAEMVRAILDGRKTQTRRMVKPQRHQLGYIMQPEEVADEVRLMMPTAKVPIHVGDIIWVRETFYEAPEGGIYSYRADGEMIESARMIGCRWTPSIHMPRWASRIDLEVTAVRVERLQDISEEDAWSEGCKGFRDSMQTDSYLWFRDLWQSIYANWDANPWVWVYEFRRVK